MKNILILNVGTRNILIRDFKKVVAEKSKIVATDNFKLAPALYDADKYYITPWIDADNYWDVIDEICVKENIGLIVSLIDPELEILAKQKERFERKGILVNTSSYRIIHDTYDKFCTLEYLRIHGFPWIETYKSIDDVIDKIENNQLQFPLFIKPRCGSGSQGIKKISDKAELVALYEEGMIVQEYMEGQEIGVDVFVDLISGKVSSLFAKKKIKMRAGETDKSVSYKSTKLFETIIRFAEQYGLRGVNDIDVFEKEGEFYISEVNPRFGGGYLHAHACGINFPQMLVNNMNGVVNSINIGNYDENVYMMKYFDIKIMKD